jgi:hypothetical protein
MDKITNIAFTWAALVVELPGILPFKIVRKIRKTEVKTLYLKSYFFAALISHHKTQPVIL